MKLVTSSQMQKLDQAAIKNHGIPSLSLMESAGAAVADSAMEYAKKKKGAVVIICGRGNNGGDGLVAARYLIESGANVEIYLTCKSSELSADAKANWERLAPLSTHIYEISSADEIKLHHPIVAGASVIIDAVFGTGLTRNVTGWLVELIEYVNLLRRHVIAVDIPSGLSANTGKPLGACIKANQTVTFGLPKLGLIIDGAETWAGKISVVDIGIPLEEVDSIKTPYRLTDKTELKGIIEERKLQSHKGSFGHVAIIAGAGGRLGAGYLTSMAALRTGAGLVTYYLPESAFEKFDARYPEIMCEPVPDKGRGHFHPDGIKELIEKLKDKTVLALGPAIGTHAETVEFQKMLLASVSIPIVIDADGLNNLEPAQLRRLTYPPVITPHPKEFGRLVRLSTEKVQENRLSLALKFAREYKSYLLLKGHNSIVANPDGTAYINPTGNPAMATAGAGDVLTGAVAGLIAQNVEPYMAAVAGAYIHGFAGDLAAEEIGERGVIASDIIKRIPRVLEEVFAK